MSYDAQLRFCESILTIVVMDSGPSAHPGMTTFYAPGCIV
jgi:hypothetical protein